MQGTDHQIIQMYQVLSLLISLASLVMFSVAAFVILAYGRSSTERTLIGIGAILQAISVLISMGMSLVQKIGLGGDFGVSIFIFFALSHLISFVGVALGLWGAVKLLSRAAQLELLLEDPDDDR